MTRSDFNDFVLRQSIILYGYAFRILRNQEEAEDAVQEVFIKLWKMKEKLIEYYSLDALATTITKNYCIDQLRKRKNSYQDTAGKQDYSDEMLPSPHEQLEIKESNDILYNIINNLPETYRILVRLRDIEGMSYDEIAEKTHQNINSLRVTLSRARRFIRDEYKKYQYERRGTETITGKVL